MYANHIIVLYVIDELFFNHLFEYYYVILLCFIHKLFITGALQWFAQPTLETKMKLS